MDTAPTPNPPHNPPTYKSPTPNPPYPLTAPNQQSNQYFDTGEMNENESQTAGASGVKN